MSTAMIALLCFFLSLLASLFKSKSRLEAENSALRHQLIVLQRRVSGRVKLTNGDRLFLVMLCRWFPSILQAITIIRPANGCLPDSLLSCHPTPRTTVLDVVWCDIKSDRGVDLASDYREAFPWDHAPEYPDQGSGQVVWIGLRATSVRYGHSRSADRPAITLAKRLR
jgi:hypothetical protein